MKKQGASEATPLDYNESKQTTQYSFFGVKNPNI